MKPVRRYILEARRTYYRDAAGYTRSKPNKKAPDDTFSPFGPKAEKTIGSVRGVVDAISGVIHLGQQISWIMRSAGQMHDDIKAYFHARKKKRDFNHITVKSIAYAKAIINRDKSQIRKLSQDIRTDSLNSMAAIRILFAVEVALALYYVESPHETSDAIRMILPRHWNNKDIQYVVNHRNDAKELKGVKETQLETISHYPKRYKLGQV